MGPAPGETGQCPEDCVCVARLGGVGTEGYLIKLGSEKAFLEGVMSNRILKQ